MNFCLAFKGLEISVCYKVLSFLESDEREERGGGEGRRETEGVRREVNMEKQSIMFSNCDL